MTSPQPTPPVGGQQFFDSIRGSGFSRAPSRWIGGVASGLASRLRVDPLIIRGAFLIAGIVVTGITLLVYAVAWLLLPEQRDGRIHLEQAFRGVFDGALVGIGVMVVLGLGSIDNFFVFGNNTSPVAAVFWIVASIAVAIGIYYLVQQSGPSSPTASHPAPGAAPAQGHSTTSFTQAHPTPADQSTTQVIPAQSPEPTDAVHDHSGTPVSDAAPGSATPWSAPASQTGTTSGWTPPPVHNSSNPTGGSQFALLLGLVFLVAAGFLVADTSGMLVDDLSLVALVSAIALVLGGLAVVVNGIRGYSSGSSGFFAIVALIVTLSATSATASGISITRDNWRVLGDSTYTPTSLSQVTDGFAFGVGDTTLDLTELEEPPRDDQPVTIAVSGGIGDITIVVPSDVAVTANQGVGIGETRKEGANTSSSTGGIGVGIVTYENSRAEAGEDPVFDLDITMGIGSITITEEIS